jgi:frataxin-like iron-binding protein CyaY
MTNKELDKIEQRIDEIDKELDTLSFTELFFGSEGNALSNELESLIDQIQGDMPKEIELPANVLKLDQNKRKRALINNNYKNNAKVLEFKNR